MPRGRGHWPCQRLGDHRRLQRVPERSGTAVGRIAGCYGVGRDRLAPRRFRWAVVAVLVAPDSVTVDDVNGALENQLARLATQGHSVRI